jgi:hypothetical protein
MVRKVAGGFSPESRVEPGESRRTWHPLPLGLGGFCPAEPNLTALSPLALGEPIAKLH